MSPRPTRLITTPEDVLDVPDDAMLIAFAKISADLKKGARELTPSQARYAVDTYYQMQQFRIEAANQVRAATTQGEPTAFLTWIATLTRKLENTITSALNEYTETLLVARWTKSIFGIGPVLSAGLAAHIDIRRAETAGAIWRFAGLDPTSIWKKGEKRPWNAALKVIAWKCGESFVKGHNADKDIYGHVYAERKAYEHAKNDAGDYAALAARILAEKDWRRDTITRKAYEAGRLSDGHIHARAKRYAVKLFLSHYHYVAYEIEYGRPPANPYIIEHGGHTHFIKPPNWPMVEKNSPVVGAHPTNRASGLRNASH